MSVSFFVDMGTIEFYRVTCMCPNAEGETFNSYDDAAFRLMVMQEKRLSVEGCTNKFDGTDEIHIEACHDASNTAEINMSNRNAYDILNHLGIDADAEGWAGAFDARDLMARIDIALSVAPDSAIIPTVDEGKMVVCGREEGYVQNRLAQLIPVCEDAIKLNREVVWS